MKCNREVTRISRQRPCVYTRMTEVKCSYKPSVCLLRSLLWNYCVRVDYITLLCSDIPVF